MLQIQVPLSVIRAYAIIIPIAKWNVFDGLPWGPASWFVSSEVEAGSSALKLSLQRRLLGYSLHDLFANIGTFTFFWLVYFAKGFVLLILFGLRQGYGNQRRFQTFWLRLFKDVLFTELFMISLEGYL